MARIVKIVKTIRIHWKKSTFLALAVAYGTNYTIEHFQTRELMRAYCLEAKRYGDEKIPDGASPKNITVVLNPTANKRKAAKQFEKYCAPILHLAGICVDVVQTESEGHARTLVEKLKSTDALIIAGGDGTVSEAITGLFRRTDDDRILNSCPVGILPLGQTNSLGRVLFPGGETLATVKSLGDASMAIIRENTKLVDVMKIEIIPNEAANAQKSEDNHENNVVQVQSIDGENNLLVKDKTSVNNTVSENQNEKRTRDKNISLEKDSKISEVNTILEDNNQEKAHAVKIENSLIKKDDKDLENETNSSDKNEENPKPIYALASLEWGAFRDAHAKQDKYWYWGSLRKYATYIFNGYKSSLTWECNAEINYLEPCKGCSNCYIPQKNNNSRWWSRLWLRPKPAGIDYSKIINEQCGQPHTKEVVTSDFTLKTANVLGADEHKLQLNIGPDDIKYLDFVQEGFKTVKGEDRHFKDTINARQLELLPKNIDEKEIWFSIDKEEYEAMPVRITVLPHVLRVFCKTGKS